MRAFFDNDLGKWKTIKYLAVGTVPKFNGWGRCYLITTVSYSGLYKVVTVNIYMYIMFLLEIKTLNGIEWL